MKLGSLLFPLLKSAFPGWVRTARGVGEYRRLCLQK
jgi:hypothetical protein